jgi:hypothetical protein
LFDDGVGHEGFVVTWGDDHGKGGAEAGGFDAEVDCFPAVKDV